MSTLSATPIMQNFPSNKRYYVNNEEFLSKIRKFKSDYNKGVVSRIPEDIAQIIYNIALNLSKSPKFNGYTYKDEMISDGVLNCLEKIHNFSPRKSKNPFAYFTQIIYFAFLRRIKGENKHSYIKNKMMQNFVDELTLHEKQAKIKKRYHYESEHEKWGKMEEEILEKEKEKKRRKNVRKSKK